MKDAPQETVISPERGNLLVQSSLEVKKRLGSDGVHLGLHQDAPDAIVKRVQIRAPCRQVTTSIGFRPPGKKSPIELVGKISDIQV